MQFNNREGYDRIVIRSGQQTHVYFYSHDDKNINDQMIYFNIYFPIIVYKLKIDSHLK
jgi:hypothetical protein